SDAVSRPNESTHPFHSVSKGDIAQSGGQWRGRDRGDAPHATPSQKLPRKSGKYPYDHWL
ncbi:hypothetical protein, partial [Alteromonas australica]|uniref:hypothetical protein n=1 Tax=Alteromonas australica TaxID=589873 RepID=UPI0024933732